MNIARRIKKIKKIVKRKRFFLETRRTIYKVVWGNAAALMEREFLAAADTKNPSSVWKERGTFFGKRISLLGKVLVCSTERLARSATIVETDRFVQLLIDSVPDNCPRKAWNEIFDRDRFRTVWDALSPGRRAAVSASLDGVVLALTGAHGDFRDRHVFVDESGGFRTIDWEYYRSEGSLVCDILRLYSRRFSEGRAASYLRPDVFLPSGFPVALSRNLFGGKEVPGLKALGMLCAFEYACTPNGNTAKRAGHISELAFVGLG